MVGGVGWGGAEAACRRGFRCARCTQRQRQRVLPFFALCPRFLTLEHAVAVQRVRRVALVQQQRQLAIEDHATGLAAEGALARLDLPHRLLRLCTRGGEKGDKPEQARASR